MTESPAVPDLKTMLGLDPTDPAFLADPYPAYARLRRESPVLRTPAGFWLLTRYDECCTVLQDDRYGYPEGDPGDSFFVAGFAKQRNFLFFMNPPDHTRMRGSVRTALTPKIVHALRPYVQAATDRLLDEAMSGGGEFDLVNSVAHPLPFGTICELLAVPDADRPMIHRLAAQYLAGIGASFAVTRELGEARDRALDELNEYFRTLALERSGTPGPDILTHLVKAEAAGSMSETELLGTCVLLFVAGHGTTTNMIGNAALALIRHPHELARFLGEPDLEGNAIEELLRYDSSTHQSYRLAREDTELGGQRISKGEQLLVVRGSANRDPEIFTDPDRLDLSRGDTRHLTFGNGRHICLGSALARMQIRVALRTLFTRSPTLRLATENLEYYPSLLQRGLKALPLLPT
jgi:cytochrome P450